MRYFFSLFFACFTFVFFQCTTTQAYQPKYPPFDDDDHEHDELPPILVAVPLPSTADTIYLSNPSFEDNPGCCKAPQFWSNCGDKGETPPDIQPGSFGLEMQAQDGNTFVGMVVRDNQTAECLYQKLPHALEIGKNYQFSIYLAQAEYLFSVSRSSRQNSDYDEPVRFILGGMVNEGGEVEVLARSAPIFNQGWKPYRFEFSPMTNIRYLVLQVTWADGEAVDGHLLLDECAPIIRLRD